MQIYKDNWREYLKLGLIPLPASKKSKQPIVDWKVYQKDPPCTDEYLEWETKYPDYNLWVYLGDRFVATDPDGKGAEELTQSLNLPRCPTAISGNQSTHRYFKASYPIEPCKVKNGDGTFLEIRTGGQGMLVPPSIHPITKKAYFWLPGFSPWEIEFPEFPKEAYRKIKTLLNKTEPESEQPKMDSIPEGSLDVPKYLIAHNIPFKEKKEASRTIYALSRCLWADNHTTKSVQGDSAIIQGNDGKLGYQCFHNHCSDKTWADARKAISGDDSVFKFCKSYIEPNQDGLIAEDVISFIHRPIDNPEQLIGSGILPSKGQLIIGGSGKRGKSVLAENVALNLSTGTPAFGQFPIPKKRKGVIFQAEISEVSMQDRLKKMVTSMPVRPEPGYLSIVNRKGLNLNKQKDFDEICRKIDQCQAEYIIIDPMFRFHHGDENKSSEMKGFFSRLDEMTLKFGVAVMLVHHFGKPTEFEREGGQQLRGSSTIFDYGDTYLSLKRQSKNKPKEYVMLSFELRNAEDPQPLYLWRNPETLWYEVQAIDSASFVTDHDIIALIQASNGEIMKSKLKELIIEKFKVAEVTAGRSIEHASHLFIEETLKAKGSPIKIKLKPDFHSPYLKAFREMEG